MSTMLDLDYEACYRAFQTKDARFDGRVFVGVRTTGIYCRPVCPARSPKLENCTYFPSAAAAQAAGFRPCLRCHPECSPEVPVWQGTASTVSRALDLIADGALDGDTTVDALALRLGIGERQLRRLFLQHLGASPIAVAQTRRFLFAKQLIHDTRLPMSEIALAAGFGSIRRFNATFRTLYGRAPRELRRTSKQDVPSSASEAVQLRITYRPPYDWDSILSFLLARAISGVELVENGEYLRTVSYDGRCGTIRVSHNPRQKQLLVAIRFPDVRALPVLMRRVRRVFDTGADVDAIARDLSRDPWLAPLVARRPGLRLPGGWDGFEIATRAVLGQQITVQAARLLACALTASFGEPMPEDAGFDRRLTHIFPTPGRIAAADLSVLGMPSARRTALSSLAAAAVDDPQLFTRGESLEEAVRRLALLPGIGDWTAQYVAMRGLRETDAFPVTDIALLRAAGDGHRANPAELLQRAEAWRPWRAYAAQYLWSHDAHTQAGRGPSAAQVPARQVVHAVRSAPPRF